MKHTTYLTDFARWVAMHGASLAGYQQLVADVAGDSSGAIPGGQLHHLVERAVDVADRRGEGGGDVQSMA